MASALQTILAEMTVKDLASGNLKKIQDAVMKDIEALKKGEKQVSGFQKALEKIKGMVGGGSAGGVIGSLNQRAQGMAQAVGSGSAFQHAISQIHFVGPYLAAALTAVEGSAQNFVAGAKLAKEQKVAEANFAMQFRRTTIANTDLMSDTYFHLRDKQTALTALADAGVKGETVTKHAGALQQFAKAQGHDTMEGAMQALTSGNIKANRGLSAIQIKMIQAYTPLLKDAVTADIGMRGIARVLGQSEKPIKSAADKFNNMAGAAIKTTVGIQNTEEATTILGTGSAEAFEAAHTVKRANNELMNTLGAGAGSVVNAISDAINAGSSENRREMNRRQRQQRGGGNRRHRATGGESNSNESIIVGENGPEIFRPNTSGRIIPGAGGGGRSVTMNNYFNISGGSASVIESAVMSALNKAARTIWRQNTGLQPAG